MWTDETTVQKPNGIMIPLRIPTIDGFKVVQDFVHSIAIREARKQFPWLVDLLARRSPTKQRFFWFPMFGPAKKKKFEWRSLIS